MKRPLITAHTGCMNTRPNSIESVIEGIKAGADIIEVDIRATKDGVIVLAHDEHISTEHGVKRIADLSVEELNSFTKDAPIIKLQEVLPFIRESHRIINLDVKEDLAIDPMIKIIEEYNMKDYSIITGCEKDRALHLKKHYPTYQVLLNASMSLFNQSKENYADFVKETYQDAIAASCCGININYHLCQEELLNVAARRCLPVLVWTVDDSHVMEKFLDMGVHSITTQEVRILTELRDMRI
ncbi:glycerophosphodiester phosphodiesterase [Ectobacillus funiculus]|uniref:Glycerophosphodiester phosphodiesterase n=1 Tax=Ectobacillus funiculus TaxID=137993 RepID=A0ABV5WEF1_9BACI